MLPKSMFLLCNFITVPRFFLQVKFYSEKIKQNKGNTGKGLLKFPQYKCQQIKIWRWKKLVSVFPLYILTFHSVLTLCLLISYTFNSGLYTAWIFAVMCLWGASHTVPKHQEGPCHLAHSITLERQLKKKSPHSHLRPGKWSSALPWRMTWSWTPRIGHEWTKERVARSTLTRAWLSRHKANGWWPGRSWHNPTS